MLTVFSGGTGTPKLLRGLKELCNFAVIVNTAEDIWISGNKICPDIDSVMYSLSELIDTNKWWGIKEDTFVTHEMLKKLGYEEMLKVGDMDRAIHILRSELLRKGYSLTEATRQIAKRLGVKQDVLPMCEEEVETIIVTPYGEMHFQEFWVSKRGEPEVIDVFFRNIENAKATDDVVSMLEKSEVILIGPSNPITSIMPILEVRGIKETIYDKKVIAVSPIIGNRAFSGPAGKLMRAKGFEVSPLGILEIYKDFLDVLIVDKSDEKLSGKYKDIQIIAENTVINNKKDAIKLSKTILSLIDS